MKYPYSLKLSRLISKKFKQYHVNDAALEKVIRTLIFVNNSEAEIKEAMQQHLSDDMTDDIHYTVITDIVKNEVITSVAFRPVVPHKHKAVSRYRYDFHINEELVDTYFSKHLKTTK